MIVNIGPCKKFYFRFNVNIVLLHNDGCLDIQIVSFDEIINSIGPRVTDELKYNRCKVKRVEIIEEWTIKNKGA